MPSCARAACLTLQNTPLCIVSGIECKNIVRNKGRGECSMWTCCVTAPPQRPPFTPLSFITVFASIIGCRESGATARGCLHPAEVQTRSATKCSASLRGQGTLAHTLTGGRCTAGQAASMPARARRGPAAACRWRGGRGFWQGRAAPVPPLLSSQFAFARACEHKSGDREGLYERRRQEETFGRHGN